MLLETCCWDTLNSIINTIIKPFKLLPTYSHRKKALKFFILLSITLWGETNLVTQEKPVHGHSKWKNQCNSLEQLISFQREGANSSDGI